MGLKIENILCMTDFSDFSNAAAPYAVTLAERIGSRLFIGHVAGRGIDRNAAENMRLRLAELTKSESIRPVPLVSSGKVVEAIARMIRDNRIDLLVLASREKSGIERLVFGSVAEELIRNLSCPILVFPPVDPDSETASEKQIGFERILVGSDFSKESDLALEYGLLIAKAFQSELHLVHALEIPYDQNLLVTALEVEEGVREKTRKEIEEALAGRMPEELYNRCMVKLKDLVKDSRCNSRTAVLEGNPFPALIEYAEANRIEMIVLGRKSRTPLNILFSGSTPDRIIRRAQFAVLSVCPACTS